MVYQAEDRAKVRRQQAEAAIQLALQGRWDEAEVTIHKFGGAPAVEEDEEETEETEGEE